MKTWVAIASIALILGGCSKGGGRASERGGATHRLGVFEVSVSGKPDRPVVGDNTLVIAVQDTSGAPVPGAKVGVLVSMPAMGAMPYMESRGEVKETRPGVYEARYGLSMGGDWDVAIRIRSKETRAEGDYRVSTNLPGVSFAGGTPPVGAAGAPRGDHAGRSVMGDSLEDAGAAGAVRLDPARRQAIGVTSEPVGRRDLSATIRASGIVQYDETRRAEVALKFSGWVREIHVDYVGREVQRGEVLFTAYSPALFAAQLEFLEALRAEGPEASELAAAARQRLRLWDIPPSQLEVIAKSGAPMEALPIVAPVSGVVIEKSIVQGSAFMASQTLYRIAPVDPIWVLASVYPHELPLVETGMPATIRAPLGGVSDRRGRVAYVNPYVTPETRSGEVRLEVRNPTGDLRPGLYVDVSLERTLPDRLAIPETAVLYSGPRRLVFVDAGDGRLVPREVTLGAKAGSYFEVLGGLREGDIVVTSGNFLIAAESRLRAATQDR